MNKVKVGIELCRPEAKLPVYMHIGDAGMDVFAAADVTIAPGETKVVPLGIKVAIPSGYELQVRARSGLSLKTRLRVANGIGTIDAGYRDEVGVILHNCTSPTDPAITAHIMDLTEKQNRPGTYAIKTGDRIAQMVLAPVMFADLATVDNVAEIGNNRGGGLGHSGV